MPSASPPAVSIGVPVFNAAGTLRAALETLRAQTFADFEAIIFDNASTDGTAAIALEFAARDDRFVYFAQERNVGALRNFLDALARARAPLFLWRAADDGADPAYLAALVAALAQAPHAALAVGVVETRDDAGRLLRRAAFPALARDGGGRDRLKLLFQSHPSWIYGLFRREALLARTQAIRARYDHPWAWDHLTLLPFLLDARVVEAPGARFVQSLRRPPGAARRSKPSAATMARLRAGFLAIAREDVARRFVGAQRLLWSAVMRVYVGKRVYRWRRVAWRAVAERFGAGDAPAESAGFEKYF